MTQYAAIREIMMEILAMMFQAPDVTATQQMGVQMSNAVREKGIVIIQNQNVEVMARIGPSILKALRLCEEAADLRLDPITLQLPAPEVHEGDPIEDCCRYFYDNVYGLEDAKDTVRDRYIEYVILKRGTKAAAAKYLGIGATYLSRITNHPKQPKTPEEEPND